MSAPQYCHAKSDENHWNYLRKNLLLGSAFESVWCRHLILEAPCVWQVKLTSGQEVPSHSFESTTVLIMTYGSLAIEGEHDFEAGDVRWAHGGVVAGGARASSTGAIFYLVGMEGSPCAKIQKLSTTSDPSRKWQRQSPHALPWGEVAMGEHVAPPGRSCNLCPDGPSVTLLEFDPNCVIQPHSHPGNIVYIMLKGHMRVPEEGVYHEGDLRWGAKDFAYGPEVMGPLGCRMIAIQKDEPLGVNWSDE